MRLLRLSICAVLRDPNGTSSSSSSSTSAARSTLQKGQYWRLRQAIAGIVSSCPTLPSADGCFFTAVRTKRCTSVLQAWERRSASRRRPAGRLLHRAGSLRGEGSAGFADLFDRLAIAALKCCPEVEDEAACWGDLSGSDSPLSGIRLTAASMLNVQ